MKMGTNYGDGMKMGLRRLLVLEMAERRNVDGRQPWKWAEAVIKIGWRWVPVLKMEMGVV